MELVMDNVQREVLLES